MTLTGSCHCGKIAYELEGDTPTAALSCNCSMCRRKGSLLHFAPADSFTLKGSRDDLSTYEFNKHAIQHHFCTACGCSPFAEGKNPKGDRMVAINLRCADGVDLDALEINHIDGASR